MCYKVVNSLKCHFCDERAVVYRACVDSSGRIQDCNEYLVQETGDNSPGHDVVCVKSDDAIDVSHICGWCVCYISGGHLEEGKPRPCSIDYILQCGSSPESVVDYMVHTISETDLPVAEDSSLSGYRDMQGNVTVVFSTYEQYGDRNTTVVYPASNKRRRYD